MDENWVEMLADEDEIFWDQPCVYGCRIESHSVYCHNDKWREKPRKCRRTWYTGGEIKDEDCPGFSLNPNYSEPNKSK
jgi:hypothetical protein